MPVSSRSPRGGRRPISRGASLPAPRPARAYTARRAFKTRSGCKGPSCPAAAAARISAHKSREPATQALPGRQCPE
eukprot:3046277-Pyramimonas_sp.AAC.1